MFLSTLSDQATASFSPRTYMHFHCSVHNICTDAYHEDITETNIVWYGTIWYHIVPYRSALRSLNRACFTSTLQLMSSSRQLEHQLIHHDWPSSSLRTPSRNESSCYWWFSCQHDRGAAVPVQSVHQASSWKPSNSCWFLHYQQGDSKPSRRINRIWIVGRPQISRILWVQCWSSGQPVDIASAVSPPPPRRTDSTSALGTFLHEVLPNRTASMCSGWWTERGSGSQDSQEVHLAIHRGHCWPGVPCCEYCLLSFSI